MQSRRKFILLAFALNSSIICSEDNGMSRCTFINANPFNRDCPAVFLKYVFERLGLKKKTMEGGYISPIIAPAHATVHAYLMPWLASCCTSYHNDTCTHSQHQPFSRSRANYHYFVYLVFFLLFTHVPHTWVLSTHTYALNTFVVTCRFDPNNISHYSGRAPYPCTNDASIANYSLAMPTRIVVVTTCVYRGGNRSVGLSDFNHVFTSKPSRNTPRVVWRVKNYENWNI
jgi:hypothetical protein